jgi:hypothetical protein
MEKGGIRYRIISDHLGSPRSVVNSQTGEGVQQLVYWKFLGGDEKDLSGRQ